MTLGEQHLTSAVAGSIKREWSAGRLGCGREAVSATSGRLACEPAPQTLPGNESGQIAVSVVRFPDSGDERRSMVRLVRVGCRAGHVQLRPREAAPPPAAQHGPDSAGQVSAVPGLRPRIAPSCGPCRTRSATWFTGVRRICARARTCGPGPGKTGARTRPWKCFRTVRRSPRSAPWQVRFPCRE